MSLAKTIKDVAVLAAQATTISKKIKDITNVIEKRVERQINKAKKDIAKTMLFIVFLSMTIVFLSAGLIVLLSKFFPLEIILLIFGVVFAIVTVWVKFL